MLRKAILLRFQSCHAKTKTKKAVAMMRSFADESLLDFSLMTNDERANKRREPAAKLIQGWWRGYGKWRSFHFFLKHLETRWGLTVQKINAIPLDEWEKLIMDRMFRKSLRIFVMKILQLSKSRERVNTPSFLLCMRISQRPVELFPRPLERTIMLERTKASVKGVADAWGSLVAQVNGTAAGGSRRKLCVKLIEEMAGYQKISVEWNMCTKDELKTIFFAGLVKETTINNDPVAIRRIREEILAKYGGSDALDDFDQRYKANEAERVERARNDAERVKRGEWRGDEAMPLITREYSGAHLFCASMCAAGGKVEYPRGPDGKPLDSMEGLRKQEKEFAVVREYLLQAYPLDTKAWDQIYKIISNFISGFRVMLRLYDVEVDCRDFLLDMLDRNANVNSIYTQLLAGTFRFGELCDAMTVVAVAIEQLLSAMGDAGIQKIRNKWMAIEAVMPAARECVVLQPDIICDIFGHIYESLILIKCHVRNYAGVKCALAIETEGRATIVASAVELLSSAAIREGFTSRWIADGAKVFLEGFLLDIPGFNRCFTAEEEEAPPPPSSLYEDYGLSYKSARAANGQLVIWPEQLFLLSRDGYWVTSIYLGIMTRLFAKLFFGGDADFFEVLVDSSKLPATIAVYKPQMENMHLGIVYFSIAATVENFINYYICGDVNGSEFYEVDDCCGGGGGSGGGGGGGGKKSKKKGVLRTRDIKKEEKEEEEEGEDKKSELTIGVEFKKKVRELLLDGFNRRIGASKYSIPYYIEEQGVQGSNQHYYGRLFDVEMARLLILVDGLPSSMMEEEKKEEVKMVLERCLDPECKVPEAM